MATRCQLHSSRENYVLAPSDVHLWFVDLRLDVESLSDLRRKLSAEEETRAQQFHSPADQNRSIASRGLLRTLLAHYALLQPEQLLFAYNPAGKPALASGCSSKDIRFNLTHSGDHALIAIASGREVGVDIERVARHDDHEKLARRFFSLAELASFLQYPAGEHAEAFLRHWVRKEAYLKARGFGLTRHDEGFDAPLTRETVSTFTHADGTTWSAREILPTPGHVAAVVAEGVDWQLKFFGVLTDASLVQDSPKSRSRTISSAGRSGPPSR
jgi:4'-phosphopantetheinyl transferase